MIERYNVLLGEYDCYAVSNYGNVKNLRNEYILKSGKDMYGYPTVLLSKNGKKKRVRVHILVANSFLPKVEGKNYINHKDGKKYNNHIDNLEWCTVQYNAQHSHRLGLQKPSERQKTIISQWDRENHSKPVSQYSKNGDWVKDWAQQKEAEMALGLCLGSISQCVRGKSKTAGGFIWKRK